MGLIVSIITSLGCKEKATPKSDSKKETPATVVDIKESPKEEKPINISSFIEDLTSDEYWERGTISNSETGSDSEILKDVICHPRVIVLNSKIHLFYLNARNRENISGLSPVELIHMPLGEQPKILDTLSTRLYRGKDELVDFHSSLQITNSSLLYRKLNKLDNKKWDYFEYNISQASSIKTISEYKFFSAQKALGRPRGTISNDNRMVAYEFDYSLYIRFGYGFIEKLHTDEFDKLVQYKVKNGFDATDLIADKAPSNYIVVGTMCWSVDDQELFFDNSGPDLACIWHVDIKNRKTTKIVPEHDAITPWSFDYKNKRYVVYGFWNKLMIAEKPL